MSKIFYIVPPPAAPVIFVGVKRQIYPSVAALAQALNKAGWRIWRLRLAIDERRLTFFDRFGEALDPGELLRIVEILAEKRYVSRYGWRPRYGAGLKPRFRIDPLPYTGHKPRRGKCYRKPSTQSERRQSGRVHADLAELEMMGVGSVRKSGFGNRYLCSLWDDLPVSAWRNRNWKEFRKTRWRDGDRPPILCEK